MEGSVSLYVLKDRPNNKINVFARLAISEQNHALHVKLERTKTKPARTPAKNAMLVRIHQI